MFIHSKTLPHWAFLSLAANGLLLLIVTVLLFKERSPLPNSQETNSRNLKTRWQSASTKLVSKTLTARQNLGPRHQLRYDQWVMLLAQEAEAVATKQPKHLSVIAGDSLSLWFPTDLLPSDSYWLNQGISGETSGGLLNRLELFDKTQPSKIFVMIGINDLLKGIEDEKILANQRRIVRYLRRVHPDSQIVLQSILPHGAENSTWEGRDRLLAIPNSRIRRLNKQLAAIASEAGVNYLDLYSLFSDEKGELHSEFTTDGLHLNFQGYLVWRTALQLFSRLQLKSAYEFD